MFMIIIISNHSVVISSANMFGTVTTVVSGEDTDTTSCRTNASAGVVMGSVDRPTGARAKAATSCSRKISTGLTFLNQLPLQSMCKKGFFLLGVHDYPLRNSVHDVI
jgi:hypothetical protein